MVEPILSNNDSSESAIKVNPELVDLTQDDDLDTSEIILLQPSPRRPPLPGQQQNKSSTTNTNTTTSPPKANRSAPSVLLLSDSNSDSDTDCIVSPPRSASRMKARSRSLKIVATANSCIMPGQSIRCRRPSNAPYPAPLSTVLPPIEISKPAPSRPQPPPSPPNALKCPICIETYITVKQRGFKIVTTKCGHIFCDFCLKKALSSNGRKCPKCRKNVPRAGVIEIFDVC